MNINLEFQIKSLKRAFPFSPDFAEGAILEFYLFIYLFKKGRPSKAWQTQLVYILIKTKYLWPIILETCFCINMIYLNLFKY